MGTHDNLMKTHSFNGAIMVTTSLPLYLLARVSIIALVRLIYDVLVCHVLSSMMFHVILNENKITYGKLNF